MNFPPQIERPNSENLSNSMQNLIKVSKSKEFQNCTLLESETGLEKERSDTSSDHVSHACAYEIRLHNFISLSLHTERQAVIEVPDDSNRCKCLLPTTVLTSSDRSPLTRKGQTSDDNSTAVKFNDNISEVALSQHSFCR